jgi:hypothetical protein
MPSVDTFYRAKRALATGNVVAETTVKSADDATKPIFTLLPASGKLAGQGVRIASRGEIIAGASLNVTISYRIGLTVAGTLLATTGAVGTGGAGNFNYELVFEGVWDANSSSIRGRMFGHVAGTAVAEVINSTVISGVDPNGSTDVQVCVTALFGTSNAANDVRVKELVSETD